MTLHAGSTGQSFHRGAGALAAGLCVLALAGCGGSNDAKAPDAQASGAGLSVESVKAKAPDMLKPQPGQYTQTVKIEQFEVPGMPDAATKQMKEAIAKDRTESFCLTKEEADKGFRNMFNNLEDGSQCRYDRFDVAGGTLDAQMTCTHADRGKAVMTLKGIGSATASDVQLAMNVTGGPAPMKTMNMKMHVVSKRTGDCAP